MNKIKNYIYPSLMSLGGLTGLIYGLVIYFQSISSYDGGFEANMDTIVISFASLIVLGFGIYGLILSIQNKEYKGYALDFAVAISLFVVFGYLLSNYISASLENEAYGDTFTALTCIASIFLALGFGFKAYYSSVSKEN